MARIDIFFTSWIIIWFILYYINLFPYNPKRIEIKEHIYILFTLLWYLIKKSIKDFPTNPLDPIIKIFFK